MTDYRIPESVCRNCQKAMDGASPVGGGRAPEPGDIALCLDCGHIQAYGVDLALRELTDDEVVDVAGDPGIIHAMKMIGEFKKWKEVQNAAKTPTNDGPSGNRHARRRNAANRV